MSAKLSALAVGALRRDRVVAAATLLGAVAIAWAYLLAGAGMSMHDMDGMLMPMRLEPISPGYALVVLVMWGAMMLAMMLPSAAPMLLLYMTISAKRGQPATAAMLFAAGYVVVWLEFSLAAAAVQLLLESATILDPMLQTTSMVVSGLALLAAGAYQWTPLKQACLRRCRSPLEFVITEWREGRGGAFRMGLRHGTYCVGCCWALMALLFVGGVMNLLWIVGLALFVLVEKTVPRGAWVSRAAGAVLVLWGGAVLASQW